ncbi:MAG: type II toxin-antitoxin system RelB/DinJ family antitoxin [Anaerovoracaceae bacterium]
MANVSIRIDEKLKNDFQNVCESIGMDMSTAIKVFMKKTTNERGIPFDVSADPFYSAENIATLERRIANIECGKSKMTEHELIEE